MKLIVAADSDVVVGCHMVRAPGAALAACSRWQSKLPGVLPAGRSPAVSRALC